MTNPTGAQMVEAFCERTFDEWPPELQKAAMIGDRDGWLSYEARNLCLPWRAVHA